MTSLTELAHEECGAANGDIVIDATAGNGYDTLFLAEQVGLSGHVYAFDVQAEALERTAARLTAAGVNNFRLIHDDHANMLQVVEPRHHGRISTVMFNLGYLPRGDKSIITKSASTLAAIGSALRVLRVGGTLTILAYPGHPGGFEEMAAVESTLAEFRPTLSIRESTGGEGIRLSPKLWVVTKMRGDPTMSPRDETSTEFDG